MKVRPLGPKEFSEPYYDARPFALTNGGPWTITVKHSESHIEFVRADQQTKLEPHIAVLRKHGYRMHRFPKLEDHDLARAERRS